jgi:hypothetical protein
MLRRWFLPHFKVVFLTEKVKILRVPVTRVIVSVVNLQFDRRRLALA